MFDDGSFMTQLFGMQIMGIGMYFIMFGLTGLFILAMTLFLAPILGGQKFRDDVERIKLENEIKALKAKEDLEAKRKELEELKQRGA